MAHIYGNKECLSKEQLKYVEGLGNCSACGDNGILIVSDGEKFIIQCGNDICSSPVSVPGLKYSPTLIKTEAKL